MTFSIDVSEMGVELRLSVEKTSLIKRILGSRKSIGLEQLTTEDRRLAIAVADVRALGDEWPDEVSIQADSIMVSHRVAAALGVNAAEVLDLPPIVDLTLRTDAEGLIGSKQFRLRYQWFKGRQQQFPKRTGSILQTGAGLRRIPLWMMDALNVADGLASAGSETDHWGALARFRNALEPGVQMAPEVAAASVSMTDFLSNLTVRVADQFSIAPNPSADDYEVIPFSRERTGALSSGSDEGIDEQSAELSGREREEFQFKVRERGALPAFRVGPQSFLVIDREAMPALSVLAEMQGASTSDRSAFIRNPRPRIAEEIEEYLRRLGRLDGLSPEAEEEAIEQSAGPLFLETKEYSERVTGIAVFRRRLLASLDASSTTWLPEVFVERLSAALSSMKPAELVALREDTEQALVSGKPVVTISGMDVPARPELVKLLSEWLQGEGAGEQQQGGQAETSSGPLVLETVDNFEEERWRAAIRPRRANVAQQISPLIRTSLKLHQRESFDWQVRAWTSGFPGVLNADEQGLGKTLQTLAFLTWLKENNSRPADHQRGPVLIVAPTSLLQNWEQEVLTHIEEPGLGHLTRLYGSSIGGRKLSGTAGRDTDSGEAKLDLSFLKEAIEEGRAHRFWILTTYTTLTNYQHSLARIPFAAAVFDEIQALKNPDSLRANAARALKADFRIGLTGTPIENSAIDLWAIMDQLAPGSLGSLKEFRGRYGVPDAENMTELHSRVFRSTADLPPLALRRIKDEVAKELPAKRRRLHPRLMPDYQATVYEDARLKLARGGLGAALKMLHHIRSVSVHPSLQDQASADDFVEASARLSGTFSILREIAARGERVLVFIEHRKMQYRFIELAKAEFKLPRIDLINGETPIPKRQEIVNRFQRHLHEDGGFDILVLGPKAAGTGLTLTAATHVIHLSRWWNPAVEEQCNDRVHRLGQTRDVSIHVPMAIHSGYRENSFDCLLHSLMQRKRKLASSALWPMGDTEGDVSELQKMLSGDGGSTIGDPVVIAITEMFRRDDQPNSPIDADGSVPFQ
jgi:superfamily II DNA or RNA helicase